MMNSGLLNSALEKAIKNHGTDVLKSTQLANILSDYGAFEMHDKEKALKKDIVATLVAEKYGEKLTRWKKRQNNWKIEQEKFVSGLIKKHKFNENLVWMIADAFADAIGMPPIHTPIKQRKNIFRILFGDKMKLSGKDVYAIIAGAIIVLLIILCSIVFGNGDGSSIIAVPLLMLVHIFVLIGICNTINPRFRKHSGTGVTYACFVGEIATGVVTLLIAFADTSIVAILFLLFLCLIFSYTIGRFATYIQSRLFGYTLASILLLLIPIFGFPLIVKQHLIKNHINEYNKSIELRNTHMQQNVRLGFMGIYIGDCYSDVVMHLKKDTNIVKRIRLEDKKPGAYIEFFNVNNPNYYVNNRDVKLDFDKELQYDVSFDNDTIRLYILFFRDTVKHIQVNSIKPDLYIQKYGDPEHYYTKSPEEFVNRCSFYPYFEEQSEYINRQPYGMVEDLRERMISDYYSGITQWTFSNGIIRITKYSTQYIANDVFDTIYVRNERESQMIQKIRREQEAIEHKQRIEKERKEQEEIEKREQEQRRMEEIHKEAINQI